MGSTDQENRSKLEKISAIAMQWLEGAITEYEFAAKTTVILFGEDVNLPSGYNENLICCPHCGHDTCEC